ncbi:MAG: TIR domain-containing protein [Bacteroidota bacterium]
MSKPILFISHISAESELAGILKSHITHDFLGMVDVFVSADTDSIGAGTEWLNKIKAALTASCIQIVLCSKASVRRPWVNFEAGAGWLFDRPIIPACHSGLEPSELPMPFMALQGVSIGKVDGLRRLYASIAGALDVQPPCASFESLLRVIHAYEREYAPYLDESFRRTLDYDSIRP